MTAEARRTGWSPGALVGVLLAAALMLAPAGLDLAAVAQGQ
jgi:hypothetical protein